MGALQAGYMKNGFIRRIRCDLCDGQHKICIYIQNNKHKK